MHHICMWYITFNQSDCQIPWLYSKCVQWKGWSPLSQPYTRQLLLLATRQHYCSCMVHMKYQMLHSTSCLRIDSPSISKWLVECTMWYFHAQHARTIMLPCCRQQKLPRVRSALNCNFSPLYRERNTLEPFWLSELLCSQTIIQAFV